MSRTPANAIESVRGMGVAVSVRTSTSRRSCLNHSLWTTPNRCSSSTTTSPSLLKCTSFCSTRCVPDDDVDFAVPQSLDGGDLLLMGAEAAEHLDAHRVGAEPVGEGGVMLLREDRRGAEHRHLQPVLHSLEGGPDRDLRLAVSHVAADQVVHGVRRLHGLLHGVDGLKLVAGLRVGEGVLHLVLPDGVRREGMAGEHLPRGVQRDQLAGHLASGPLRALLGPRPFLAAEARQRRRVVAGRDVGREPVQVLRGHVELVTLGVLQRKVLALSVLTGDEPHTGEARDAVVDVDDVGAGHELREEGLAAGGVPSKGAAALGVAEHLHVREDGQRAGLELQAHALLQRCRSQRDGAGQRRAANVVRQRRPDVVAAQHLLQPLRVVGEHDDALACPGAFLGVLCEGVQPPPESGEPERPAAHPAHRRPRASSS